MKDKYTLEDLLEIMKILRSKKGCPWDREQTHESLKSYLIEETYELLEAIDLKDKNKLSEELGDVLLQVVFHSQVAEENKDFTIEDVITGICKKMILRHTHVFGSDTLDTSEKVINNWEAIKKKEKGIKTQTEALKRIPSNLPALIRSFKVQQKAAQVGFDWDNINDVFNKVYEEIHELEDVYNSKNVERITEELGDVFFALVNLARFLKVQPELALTQTIKKFIDRFEFMEKESVIAGEKLDEMTLARMDELWNKAKKNLHEN
jgi:tetrapyrrole methylase family protein/MazG family protein